ncbi:hypothetical protein CWB73_04755 [Pseudoalteromonas phenolica]|uniref:Uncharacterized protein n=1 Tax=Pseudoalteromonas phenolica TaxID=161398 RepID=A0A5S3YYI0_9GAMM|nr:hypothetical protein [Pseudoalteromonas phenolica]TMP82410.1 hypothetical protein CWB73_04755 [Pseudoalteromonas phenolica]
MKKLIALMAFVGGLFSVNSYADSVSCYVDTSKFDYYSQDFCIGSESRPNYRPVVSFKVNTVKDVSRVEWKFSGRYKTPASSCTGSRCLVEVYSRESRMTACVDKVYYTDYTWEDVNWCATAEYIYTSGNIHF